nr:hypothetical protein CFP56_08005 [Quercus suber]
MRMALSGGGDVNVRQLSTAGACRWMPSTLQMALCEYSVLVQLHCTETVGPSSDVGKDNMTSPMGAFSRKGHRKSSLLQQPRDCIKLHLAVRNSESSRSRLLKHEFRMMHEAKTDGNELPFTRYGVSEIY